MPRPSRIDIDLTALAHNGRLARSLAGTSHLMAAVKADAYGHGMVHCAQTLEPIADALAVAHVEEAVTLREANIKLPILIMEGPFDQQDLAVIKQFGFFSVVHSMEQLALIAAAPDHCPQTIWLKVDTGMHRLGVAPESVESALEELRSLGCSHTVLMSHLAFSEEPSAPLTQQQLQRWEQVTGDRSLSTSLSNSAGIMGKLRADSDWVRPGYMLYGGRSSSRFEGVPLAPVMQFHSQVMAVRQIAQGESVGYGGRWQAERSSRIATVPVGYGDGYPRTAENGTPVWIAGALCPLVGLVSMDMITVDVTNHPDVTVGAPVELWGRQLSVDTVAQHAQTIGYELLTRMPPRLPRFWLSKND